MMTHLPRLRPALAALLAAILAAVPLAAEEFFPLTNPADLGIADGAEVGELVFRGAVEIEPDEARIGGISGLEWHGGKLHAVSDDGRWLTITPDAINRSLVDVAAMEIGPLLDAEGDELTDKRRADAEAIARLPSGEWLVGFEHEHRVWRYDDYRAAPSASEDRAAPLIAGASANSGIETLAGFADGFLACGEWVDAERPNCLRVTGGSASAFHLPAPEGIAEAGGVPTDAACRADGTCYVLFRSYRREEGNRAAIVEIAEDTAPRTLAVMRPPMKLDNFEGLALREAAGRTYLYLVSDDNFRNCADNDAPGCQRTLLAKFEIPSDEPPPPPADVAPPENYETTAVVIETELGDITVALETERAPITAANFLRYAEEDRFDGTVFYRAMKLDREPMPNGLIQGGTQQDPQRVLPGIEHEPTSKTGLSHTNGALSMAMGEPGTANGDFSIMLQDQTGLDARPGSDNPTWRNGYAVFGYVTDGMDVVAAIHARPGDPDRGEGVMKGQMLAEPVRIIDVRRVEEE
ncbi:MAG: esterase-like activity of phytase family protein [Erythrobacter sp.]